jgi:hypothetical protein
VAETCSAAIKKNMLRKTGYPGKPSLVCFDLPGIC